jgi:hypothetical protein
MIDRVYGISDNDYYTQEHYHGVNNNDLRPIPLTKDILLKCGFFVSDLLIAKNGISLKHNRNGDYSLPLNNSRGEVCRVIVIEYLHQLQNLYFTLIGEELNINL